MQGRVGGGKYYVCVPVVHVHDARAASCIGCCRSGVTGTLLVNKAHSLMLYCLSVLCVCGVGGCVCYM